MKRCSILRLCKMMMLPGLLAVVLQPADILALEEYEGTSPIFGSTTLTIHGDTFDWDMAASSQDGYWRYDVYNNTTAGSGTITVAGPQNNSHLATVSGGSISGYLSYGNYGDSTEIGSPTTADYTVNGRHYTSATTTTNYTVDFSMDQLTTSGWTTYTDGTHSFTASADSSGNGTISGSESGIIFSGSWYVNENYSGTGSFNYNGVTYPQHTSNITYTLDTTNNQVISSGSYSYDGNGSYSYSWDYTGYWSSSDSGSSSYTSTTPSYTIFGNDYYATGSSWSNSNDYWGNSVNTSSYTYSAAGGSSMTISSYSSSSSGTTQWISGWDLYAGSFSSPYSSSLLDLSWDARSSPTFAPNPIWVNGTLANWAYGSIALDGTVTDSYTGGEYGEIPIDIVGSARGFSLGTSGADVRINGSSVGSYSATGHFNVNGWDVQKGAPNQTTPFFSADTLWVDGSAYPFSYGYEDTSGNRADVYATSGGMVSIVGNTSTPATGTVWVNHNGDIHAGSVTFGEGGSFAVAGVDIAVIAPEGGPEAFWVGNVFFLRTTGTNSYASFPTTGRSLELSGSDADALMVSVTNEGGTYTGTFHPATGGIFMVTQSEQMLPACAAHADGTQIPAGTVREGYAPAVQMLGSIWNYLGEAVQDDGPTGSTAAYYGNTRTAIYRTDPNDSLYLVPLVDEARRLLKIRVGSTDTVAVTMTDYSDDSASTVGSYVPAARIFQTVSGGEHAMTMPVVGVDPQNADIIWILHPAEDSGLPTSFIAHGQPWRYAGTADGVAKYLGAYTGQQMTLSAADDQGQRLVTVVDPVYNNGSTTPTEGTLSSVRDSVRLRDGTVVFSGNDVGSQVAVQHTDNENLQTINADLDIVGNNLSFGILEGDASLSGALFQFTDLLQTNEDNSTTAIANLNSTLSRPHAQWQWMRAVSNSGQSTLPVMKLDASNKLTLYDRTSGDAGVVLDPTPDGVSTIRGVLRVRAGGDIGMGGFTAGGEP